MDIRLIIPFLLLMPFSNIQAQIICGESSNFKQLHDKVGYDYEYTMNFKKSDSWTYYSMSQRHEEDTLCFHLIDSDGLPRPYEHFTVKLDSVKVHLRSNEIGNVHLICPKTVRFISLDCFYFEKSIFLPVSETAIPKTITLVIERKKGGAILSIHSRKELSFDEIKKIRYQLLIGNEPDSDDYYYYFSVAY